MLQTGLSRLRSDWQGILLPVVLVLTGLILVGGDLMGVLSLDRIQNYWPVAVIVVGLTDLIAEPKRNHPAREEHARQL
jgi:hypothetical protein